jgi:predicted GIY-YIG superfamily endonuclease
MVYFIQNKDKNVKIGYSKDIEKRKKQLETANDHNLKLIGYIPEVDQHFEGHLHGICKRFRVEKEWFRKEAIDYLKTIKPIADLIVFV